MDGQQHLPPSDPLPPGGDEPEQSAGRFLLVIALLIVLPILIVLPAAALARGTLLGTLLVDPEGPVVSDESDLEDGDVDELDSAAPAKTYEDIKRETENNTTGNHLAWPGSFYECVICLDVMKSDDMVRRLSCGHIFHSECIARWYLRKHYTCPLCMLRYMSDEHYPTYNPHDPHDVDSYEWRSLVML